jgi:hypothetical protein
MVCASSLVCYIMYVIFSFVGKMTLSRTELEGSLRRSEADIRPAMPANVLMIGEEKYCKMS